MSVSATRIATRVIPVAVAAVVTAAAAVSGLVLPVQQPADPVAPSPAVGRQLTVCPVDAADGDTVRLGAVVADGLTGGRLVGTELGDPDTSVIDLDQTGTAEQSRIDTSVVLRSEGGFSAGAGGTVLTSTATGPGQGISLTGCQVPATQHWFTGVAATADQTTRLVLTNPDSAEAQVDLHFWAADGPVGAPGSLGLVVPSTGTKIVSLTGLLPSGLKGPVAVQVTTSQGRVSAYAQSTYRDSLQPAGDGWAGSMATPQQSLVIPGVPGGRGTRELVLANPNDRRTQVGVEVLGADGTFAPADDATIDVNAQSTATASLASSLDGEPVTLRLTSPQPITAAVVSTSARSGDAADVAVQNPATPLRGLGLVGYAFGTGLDSTVVISNTGDAPAAVTVAASTFGGAAEKDQDVTVDPGATATVDLPDDGSGYVLLRTDSPTVYAGVVLTQGSGSVAGLATTPVSSTAGGAIGGRVVLDPRAGTR